MSEELPQIVSDEEFAKLLKQREEINLQGGQDCWDNSSIHRRAKHSDGLPESTVEQRFPRVAARLTTLWRSDAFSEYIKHLVVSDRDTREGFPEDVIEDLIMLHAINEVVIRKVGLEPEPKRKYPATGRPLPKT